MWSVKIYVSNRQEPFRISVASRQEGLRIRSGIFTTVEKNAIFFTSEGSQSDFSVRVGDIQAIEVTQ